MHRARPKVSPPDTKLIDALLRPEAFDYPVGSLELVETHISWVILTDEFAYKIKKPIVLEFLDFGSLEQRKFFCEEELRLNQPMAPSLYLDVVAITNDNGQLRIAGSGEPVEYAVRMRRFDEDLRLDHQLAAGNLSVSDMRELGAVIAAAHNAAEPVGKARREDHVASVVNFVWENFRTLEGFVERNPYNALIAWTKRELARINRLLWKRFDTGFVRDCHGDLHLANLVRLPGGIVPFDCIEFNPDLRAIDVMCDVAFLVMDLVARERHGLAATFLNRYLERTGDYEGIALFDFYFVYRCLVRAKVEAIAIQECATKSAREPHVAELQRYCNMASRQTGRAHPVLIAMHGLSGSGKTTVAAELMAALPAIRVRSDLERKRLFGLGEKERSDSGIGSGIYTAQSSERVYEHLFTTASALLRSGHSVIIDAAFLQQKQRDAVLQLANKLNYAGVIISVEAPEELLRQRVEDRSEQAGASEADLSVLNHQLSTAEPLNQNERKRAIVCNTADVIDIAAISGSIKAMNSSASAGTNGT